MNTQAFVKLKLAVRAVANEDAKKDLAFAGEDVWKRLGLTKEQRATIEAALVEYSERGASRALDYLRLHKHFK